MDRTKIINYLRGFDYYNIRRIYADCKDREQKYDDEIMELLRNYPLLCFEFEVLTDLDFINAKLESMCYVPVGIKSFQKLKTLVLSFNLLNSLPSELEYLKNLESIDLEKNKFTKFPLILTKLPKLRSINLKRNNLTTIPKEIENLGDSLVNLRLANNNITTLPKDISRLKKLERLTLTGNPISESEIKNIISLIPKTTEVIF